ncbi:hypothetical protein F4819DRAFT_40251 [Hypoxylon fuscum]|nr:hypothetical protein F4819DRAFT_40251 [Hypoxylon fuscum]
MNVVQIARSGDADRRTGWNRQFSWIVEFINQFIQWRDQALEILQRALYPDDNWQPSGETYRKGVDRPKYYRRDEWVKRGGQQIDFAYENFLYQVFKLAFIFQQGREVMPGELIAWRTEVNKLEAAVRSYIRPPFDWDQAWTKGYVRRVADSRFPDNIGLGTINSIPMPQMPIAPELLPEVPQLPSERRPIELNQAFLQDILPRAGLVRGGPTGQKPTNTIRPLTGKKGPTGKGPTGKGPTGKGPTGKGPTGKGPTGKGPTGKGPTGKGPTGKGPTGVTKQPPTGNPKNTPKNPPKNPKPSTGGTQGGTKKPSTGGTQGGTQKPSTGGTQKPSTGGTQKPSTDGTQKPSTDGTQKPSTSGTQKPSTGGTQFPPPPKLNPTQPIFGGGLFNSNPGFGGFFDSNPGFGNSGGLFNSNPGFGNSGGLFNSNPGFGNSGGLFGSYPGFGNSGGASGGGFGGTDGNATADGSGTGGQKRKNSDPQQGGSKKPKPSKPGDTTKQGVGDLPEGTSVLSESDESDDDAVASMAAAMRVYGMVDDAQMFPTHFGKPGARKAKSKSGSTKSSGAKSVSFSLGRISKSPRSPRVPKTPYSPRTPSTAGAARRTRGAPYRYVVS